MSVRNGACYEKRGIIFCEYSSTDNSPQSTENGIIHSMINCSAIASKRIYIKII